MEYHLVRLVSLHVKLFDAPNTLDWNTKDNGVQMITLTMNKIITKGYVFILATFFAVLPFSSSGNNYAIADMKGEVTFDYSNNDGNYLIGSGTALFEIDFSNASSRAIHVYKDPSSIQKIALAYEADSFAEISDAKGSTIHLEQEHHILMKLSSL